MKFLVDMNLSPLWIHFLSEHGIEAVHWSKVGAANAEDSTILSYAAANGWIVFTHDLDFGLMLASSGQNRPSILQVRCQDVLPSAIGNLVLRVILAAKPHLIAGALVTVDASRHRIRLLPI